MFGKGAKRKLDEDEEGLEGKTLEAAVAAGGGVGVVGGVSCPEGLSKVSYTLQRQTIFNISLMKLYSQRPLAEPSLERRVLINNMLRRIQEELQVEGSLRPLLLPPSPPPDDPMDEGFREAPPPFGVLATAAAQPSSLLVPPPPPPSPHPLAPPPQRVEPGPAPPEAGLTPASLLEEDGGGGGAPSPPTPPMSPPPPPTTPAQVTRSPSATPSHPPRVLAPAVSSASPALSDMEVAPPPAVSRTAAAAAAAANSMTVSTSPPPPHPFAPLPAAPAGHSKDCRPAGTRAEAAGVLLELRPMDALLPPGGLADISPAPCPSPAPPSPSPSGFLSDLALDDVLFADIDTSMYDFDPCTTSGAVVGVASTAGAGPVGGGGLAKLAPVVTADDLLKSLASPYSGPAPQVSANQPFKIDLTELDHIMEVLVGS